ncbi:MAG: hypothetical protein KJT03_02830, partial [Verrucomicrobiae bacterium]|nr:hypothetical protein [Verrucomicrobiae bacterium]
CLALVPAILPRNHGLRNLLVAAGIAAVMTIPWAILSGFFDTAGEVPKAYELFSSFADWSRYFLDRPVILVIFALLVVFPLASWWGVQKGWKKATAYSHNVLVALVFVITWIFFAVVCFHLVVPAASFMVERLTLILFTPIALLLGLALSEFYPRIKGVPYAASLVMPIGFLYLSHHLPGRLPKFEDQEQVIAKVIEYLKEQDLKPPCRIYGAPTDHHIWKYYTGLPIQSIVPVRRSYLETFPHDLLYLENPWVFVSPSLKSIQDRASEEGINLNDFDARTLRNDLVTNQIIQSLKARGLYEQGQKVEIPDYLGEIQKDMEVANAEAVAGAIRMWKRQVIFKDVDVPVFQDLWLAFYYRFSGYPDRIGENWNIYPILKRSEVTVLPEAKAVAYHYAGRAD